MMDNEESEVDESLDQSYDRHKGDTSIIDNCMSVEYIKQEYEDRWDSESHVGALEERCHAQPANITILQDSGSFIEHFVDKNGKVRAKKNGVFLEKYMFKIVETIGKGGKQLMIVPSAWEKDGQLSWPCINADKLIKLADSSPESSWFVMSCKLRRNYLLNYAIAEEELDRMMEQNEEAEEESDQHNSDRKRIKLMTPRRKNQYGNFESSSRKCRPSDKTSLSHGANSNFVTSTSKLQPRQQAVISHYSPTKSLIHDKETSYETVETMDQPNSSTNHPPHVEAKSDQHNAKLDKILANQALIIRNQSDLIRRFKNVATLEGQNIVTLQLGALETLLGAFTLNLDARETCLPTTDVYVNVDDDKDPIDTLDDLIRLEEKLMDKGTVNDYVQKFSYICGRKGGGNGIDNCYVLVDILFTRKFFTYCSWAGGARGNKEKIPFKIYKNTIGMFFRIVHLSDRNFTINDCEDFFKGIIRNSTRRNESNKIRSSRSKKRPKNLAYRIKDGRKLDNKEPDNRDETKMRIETTEIDECVAYSDDRSGGNGKEGEDLHDFAN